MTTHTDKLIQDGLWRDISEAPRDGTMFMALSASGRICRARWDRFQPNPSDFYEADWSECVVNVDGEYQPAIAATHFRPLPDDRCANALKIAVEALRDIDGMMFVEEHPVRIRVQEALAEIKREAGKK